MMRRLGIPLAVIAVLAALVTGCDNERYDPEPGGAALKPAFGARITDGRLRIWTGSPCAGVTRVALYFAPPETELELRAPDTEPATLEHLTVGGPYPGMEIRQPLPAQFDLRDFGEVRISVYGEQSGWGSTTQLGEALDKSADHPDDTYWFEGVGWLDPAQVAEQDGKTFLATCTPNPQ